MTREMMLQLTGRKIDTPYYCTSYYNIYKKIII